MMLQAVRSFLFGTLRGRLILGVAAVHAVMMALFIFDLTGRQRVMLLDRQAEDAAALAHSLSTSAAGWIKADDISGLQELVEAQLRYPELLFAMLADEHGRILAHTDKTRQGLYLQDLHGDVRQMMLSRTPALVDFATPAMLGDEHVGWARVGIGQKAAGRKLAEITLIGILYALAAIVLGSLIAWRMGHRITRRLYAVQDTINQVRLGNGTARSTVAGGDEAASIAREFNVMLDMLDERDLTLRKLNEDLEQRVRERTAELEQAYTDLQTAQSRFLQQQKMASVGQLAAGVAHEINNPMSFIISNMNTLGRYCTRLVEFLHAEEKAINGLAEVLPKDSRALLTELAQRRKTLKIDVVANDIGSLIRESLEGGDRVKQIVNDLKSFARLDGQEYSMANLNAGLESTLSIAWNELKHKASVTKVYGDIPPTFCNPGQLNQVFLNLLVNAAHAIERHGEVRLETRQEGGFILISVADTGCGIPADKLHRIFEPFFTTKEVGKGTGLGLSIAYDIVKKHGGEITVESESGKGTRFTVRLPIRSEENGGRNARQ